MQSGQTVDVTIDGKSRTFDVAEVLYDNDNKDLTCGHSGISRDATRWQELLIVRTAKGAIALRGAYRTRWRGEHDSETWLLVKDEDDAARLLMEMLVSGNDAVAEALITPVLAERALKSIEGWWDRVAEGA